jgi:hypothetical protein
MPSYTDSVADLEPYDVGSFRLDASRDFMTGHNRVFEPRVGTFHGKMIAVADATHGYLYKNLITLQRGVLDLLNGEWAIGSREADRLTRPG